MKVLITGGQGTIAQAITETLEKTGHLVYDFGRKELDITNEVRVEFVMDWVRPDVLINNAGYIVPSSIIDTSLEEWDKHIKINLTGAFLCSKYAILNGCKTIINIGSTSAFEGRKNWGAYCASKAGGTSLIESLVEEEIKAYSLNPARTETKMRDRLFPGEDKNTLMSPLRIAEYVGKILDNEFPNGSHIIVTKDNHVVIPKRKCPK